MEHISTNFNGVILKGLSWEVKKPIANIIVFEGMEEHTSRYDFFAKQLNKEKYNVYAFDYFGQGENVLKDLSNIGVWPDDGFDLYNQIVNDFALKLNNDLPRYAFAHSMGSFYLQNFIQFYPNTFSKIVLCGSGFKNPALGVAFFLAKLSSHGKKANEKAKLMNKLMFGNFNNKIKNAKTEYDWLSINEENIKNYINDPLCGFGPNNKFCLEFIKGMKKTYIKKCLKRINKDIHILIISGEFDPVTNYGGYVKNLENMYKKLGIQNVSSIVYKGYRHELLNETIKEEVVEDIKIFYEN